MHQRGRGGTRCADGHTVAQNWDWVGFQRQNVIALRVHRDGWPDYVTLTEAGIVAKIGVNEHGVVSGFNILRATDDREAWASRCIFQRMALDCADVKSVVALARCSSCSVIQRHSRRPKRPCHVA